MNEEQIAELNKAVSKLSEEDQRMIASGCEITDNQCLKLQENLRNPGVIAYGGPGWWDAHKKI